MLSLTAFVANTGCLLLNLGNRAAISRLFNKGIFMNTHAIDTAKKLFTKGLAGICNPMYLTIDADSQQFKSLAGQRTTFLAFHKFMFSLSDIEIAQLNNGYKRFFADNRISDMDSVFNDVALIKDAIDYQLCIRSADAFDIVNVGEDVAASWQVNIGIARDFEEVTSEHLIDLAKQMLGMSDGMKLTMCGLALFGQTWQTQLAVGLGTDSRRIRQWLACERSVPVGVWSDIKLLAEQRKAEIVELITKL